MNRRTDQTLRHFSWPMTAASRLDLVQEKGIRVRDASTTACMYHSAPDMQQKGDSDDRSTADLACRNRAVHTEHILTGSGGTSY